MAYVWAPPNSLPRLVPWAGLVCLLLLRKNRSPQAWWVAALALALTLGLGVVGASITDSFAGVGVQTAIAVVFGLAAAWLLSPYFDEQIRFLAFLGTVAAVEIWGILVSLCRQEASTSDEWTRLLVSVALFGLVLSAALHLAGWSCRRRFAPVPFSLWLILWLGISWTLAFAGLCLVLGSGPFWQMAVAWTGAIALSFGALLPFLLLSFLNRFFRTRLQEMLRLEQDRETAEAAVSDTAV